VGDGRPRDSNNVESLGGCSVSLGGDGRPGVSHTDVSVGSGIGVTCIVFVAVAPGMFVGIVS
jgi:hypothetical protein